MALNQSISQQWRGLIAGPRTADGPLRSWWRGAPNGSVTRGPSHAGEGLYRPRGAIDRPEPVETARLRFPCRIDYVLLSLLCAKWMGAGRCVFNRTVCRSGSVGPRNASHPVWLRPLPLVGLNRGEHVGERRAEREHDSDVYPDHSCSVSLLFIPEIVKKKR